MNHDSYSDAYIRDILARSRTIAMVGASPTPSRPSYFAMKYLKEKGFRVIPVNPGQEGKTILGERVYAALPEIKEKVDIVDIFRSSEAALGITREAIAIGARVVWMQLGVRNDEAARPCRGRGLASGDEPLSEDRIWQAVGRAQLGRREFPHDIEPAPAARSQRRAAPRACHQSLNRFLAIVGPTISHKGT